MTQTNTATAVSTTGTIVSSGVAAKVEPAATVDPKAAAPAATESEVKGTLIGGDPAAEAAAGVPDKYEFELPKDSLLEEGAIERISSYAREKGLTNDQARDLAEYESQALTRFVDRQKAETIKQADGWLEECKVHKVYGGAKLPETVADIKRLMDKAPAAVKEFLNQTGLGNHPAMLEWLAPIARLGRPDKAVMGSAAPQVKQVSPAEKMFPRSLGIDKSDPAFSEV